MHYSELTRRYFDTAVDAGELSGERVGRGAAGTRAQGTWVQFDIRLSAGETSPLQVEAARFLAYGCPHTIAAAAWICERAPGLTVQPALPESVHSLKERFEAPVAKLGRLLIIEDAWIAAVAAAAAGGGGGAKG
jgi:NifU-like protein involved in Fe-S cluster formation